VADALRAPVDWEPLIAGLPDQLPEAAHSVAFVADQVKVELAPLVTVLGLADKLTVGAGAGEVTETLADCVALPPLPVQVSAKTLLALRAPVDCEPLKGFVPVHPFEAEHPAAFWDDHVRVELLPLVTVLGLAAMDTVGAG
jgi:hypothetical protein